MSTHSTLGVRRKMTHLPDAPPLRPLRSAPNLLATRPQAFFNGLLTALVLFAGFCQAADRPNIVFMFCDDLRYDCVGANGNKIIHTPHIDKLAGEGVSFDNVFVTTAICVTSRASIMTGQYAARSNLRMSNTRGTLSPEKLAMTYHGIMKQAGYQIGYVGKYHVGNPPKNFFDVNGAYAGQGSYMSKKRGHLTAYIGDCAEKALEDFAKSEKPFILTLGFKAPHVQDGKKPPFYPYDKQRTGHLYNDVTIPPAPLSDPEFFETQPDFIRNPKNLNRLRWTWRLKDPQQYQRSVKGYYRCVSGVDLVVGRVVKKLKDLGIDKKTIVVFSSEHGVYLGQRGLAGKWLAHEPSIRIPLIVYDPRLPAAQRGTRRKQMALTIDFAPTFLDFAGIPKGPRMQGESLVEILNGKPPANWRTEFFYDHYYKPGIIPSSEAVRTEEWKYIRYVHMKPVFEELYHLKEDPLEAKNLAKDPNYASKLEEFRKKWAEWRERAK